MSKAPRRFSSIGSLTHRNTNSTFRMSRELSMQRRSISSLTAFRLRDTIQPTAKFALKQGPADCMAMAQTYLKSQYSPPKDLSKMPFYKRIFTGSHSHVKLDHVLKQAPTTYDLEKLHDQRGPLMLKFRNITMPGTRFTEGFHCVVLKTILTLTNGKKAGLFYDPEGIPSITDVEKLIAWGDLQGIQNESDIPLDGLADANMVKDQFTIRELDEVAGRAQFDVDRDSEGRVSGATDGVYAIDPEKSTKE